MDLSSLTADQRACATCIDKPLLVSAGAGSGKTFTLTQRIAYAFSPESGPLLTDIDQLCAITFTEKAAGEIKARVKQTLRHEGLYEQALQVDAAWISTIHGMCARILRTHALELDIDPGFEILDDAEKTALRAMALDEALSEARLLDDGSAYKQLFSAFSVTSGGFGSQGVAELVDAMLTRAASCGDGLDGFRSIFDEAELPDAAAVARDLLPLCETVLDLALAEKSGKSRDKTVEVLDATVGSLNAFLLGKGLDGAGDADLGHEPTAIDVLDRCGKPLMNFGKKGGEYLQVAAELIEKAETIAAQIVLAIMAAPSSQLLELARKVDKIFQDKKRKLGKLDNDDLLQKTYQAFAQYPDIAARYADKFKLVMVDEFQDTSQLQIDFISHIAGQNNCRLCTVGDAQQSIYRFRGADVRVYEQHRQEMRSPEIGADYHELKTNFRSDSNVLSFVDSVFQQERSFGKRYMQLAPNPLRKTAWKADGRITVQNTKYAGSGDGKVTIAEARKHAAALLARRFAELRDGDPDAGLPGHAPGDMVVLFSSMSHAGLYADALREQGFECVVTGGSTFADQPEVQLTGALAYALANPADTESLFQVLAGPMFQLSADDLLTLGTAYIDVPDGGDPMPKRRKLQKALYGLTSSDSADWVNCSPALRNALGILQRAQRACAERGLSRTVLAVLTESGWLSRLEQGSAADLAVAANVLKTVRLMGHLEETYEGGAATMANLVRRQLESKPKEAPGALSAKSGDAVRLMTIHSSKGLEFPIVGVAEFQNSGRSANLNFATCGKTTLFSLMIGASAREKLGKWFTGPAALKAEAYPEDKLGSPAALLRGMVSGVREFSPLLAHQAMLADGAQEEEAESRRKLYVALTRASEALVVSLVNKIPGKTSKTLPDSLSEDIRGALFGDDAFPDGAALVDFGGTENARYLGETALPSDEEECGEVVSPATSQDVSGEAFADLLVPVPPFANVPEQVPFQAKRSGVFSYSSLSSAIHALEDQASAENEVVQMEEPLSALNENQAAIDFPVDSDVEQAELPGPIDDEKATDLGSAFHRAAEFAVVTGRVPDAYRREALAKTHGLSQRQHARFLDAVQRWFGSDAWAFASKQPYRAAELPFQVSVGDAQLEGSIDLLCAGGPDLAGRDVVIFDYKTGGYAGETEEQLHEKHLLQAECYAYATLLKGAASVTLRFMRVEQEARAGDPSQPDEVVYRFVAAQRDELHDLIAAKYAAANPLV